MSDNMLKREFRERDVQRMRNIITKDYTAKTVTQVGYTRTQVDHTEGDIWEENGKKWTIKNGIKQTLTKFDKFKKLVVMPLVCPSCNKPMASTDVNKKMWTIHNMCRSCVIDMEAQLKVDGKYVEYEKKMMNNNKNAMVDDFEVAFNEFMNTKAESYFSEQGDIETWGGGKVNEDEIKNINEYIKKLRETEI